MSAARGGIKSASELLCVNFNQDNTFVHSFLSNMYRNARMTETDILILTLRLVVFQLELVQVIQSPIVIHSVKCIQRVSLCPIEERICN